jgi:5'-deoxynucleotidase YfbR-like HD superfamily hydrolase
MTISQITQQLMADDAFVLAETQRVQYLYGLKHETRYNLPRQEAIASESVAEHVYGMHILADYFAPLELPATADRGLIRQMITWHDIDEVETGDTIGYLKTPAMRAAEHEAAERVLAKLPAHMRENAEACLREYNALATTEAQFVKAIDRIEPLFQLYTEHGRAVMHRNGTTRQQSDGLKYPYLTRFPIMRRFVDVVGDLMEREGYFVTAHATL